MFGSRRRARRAVIWTGCFAVLFTVGLWATLEFGPPKYRDPEYGRRLAAAQRRTAENPGRKMVFVFGSSRVGMGVRPDPNDAEPVALFNFAIAGSGPIMQRITLNRLLHDGIKPDAILLEYWPPFLREDSGYHEEGRFEVTRFRRCDAPLIREYFSNPANTERQMFEQRTNPWFWHREPLLMQLAASWLPNGRRTDASWADIDGWGWLATKKPLAVEHRAAAFEAGAAYYRPLFANYEVSLVADRALRDFVADCRKRNIPIALVYLPESKAFRALMPPDALRRADGHLDQIRREWNLDFIDCRGWISDDGLQDGFHMIPTVAGDFTKRLKSEAIRTFPSLASRTP